MRQLLKKVTEHPFIAERPAVRQFFKFGVVGALNTVLDYVLFTVMVVYGHVFYLAANAISFSIALVNSYILNRKWTFRSQRQDWKGEGVRYAIVYLIGLGLSELILF